MMNLSFVIVIVMLLIVLPALARRFFQSDSGAFQTIFLKASLNNNPDPDPDLKTGFNTVFSRNTRQKNTLSDNFLSDAFLADFSPITLSRLTREEISPPPVFLSEKYRVYFIVRACGGGPFRGYELLQTLQNAGFVYGKKNLFHQIKNNKILYSLAPISAPYCFDWERLGAFSTTGLRLFSMSKKNAAEMENTAKFLAEELGGQIEYA